MKYFLVILFNFFLYSVNGQNQNIDCKILQESINVDAFKTRFFICEGDDAISIIDTSKSFNECVITYVCNKKISLYHDYGSVEKKSLIEIYRIDKKNSFFTLYFHRPFTGAALIIRLKSKKGKIKVLGYKEGAF